MSLCSECKRNFGYCQLESIRKNGGLNLAVDQLDEIKKAATKLGCEEKIDNPIVNTSPVMTQDGYNFFRKQK